MRALALLSNSMVEDAEREKSSALVSRVHVCCSLAAEILLSTPLCSRVCPSCRLPARLQTVHATFLPIFAAIRSPCLSPPRPPLRPLSSLPQLPSAAILPLGSDECAAGRSPGNRDADCLQPSADSCIAMKQSIRAPVIEAAPSSAASSASAGPLIPGAPPSASFNAANLRNDLQLFVTRTWGGRKIPTGSAQWKALRQRVLARDGGHCRFCGFRSLSFVCDHIDGNAGNNDLSNLGTNCVLCDMIRHCGFHGMKGLIVLKRLPDAQAPSASAASSSSVSSSATTLKPISQVEIVRRSWAHFRAHGRMPAIHELVAGTRNVYVIRGAKGKPLDDSFSPGEAVHMTQMANVLLKFDYDQLHEECTKLFRGFFTSKAEFKAREALAPWAQDFCGGSSDASARSLSAAAQASPQPSPNHGVRVGECAQQKPDDALN